jgi:flagellar protein FlbT
MSGLVLRLAPNERVLINGAVLENGDRATKIAIKTPDVNVLRLRDAIHPDSARTPVSRACYMAQMILTGDADPVEGRRQLLLAIEQLSQVFEDRDSRLLLADTTASILEGKMYPAMRKLRDLLPREARLFAISHQ